MRREEKFVLRLLWTSQCWNYVVMPRDVSYFVPNFNVVMNIWLHFFFLQNGCIFHLHVTFGVKHWWRYNTKYYKIIWAIGDLEWALHTPFYLIFSIIFLSASNTFYIYEMHNAWNWIITCCTCTASNMAIFLFFACFC